MTVKGIDASNYNSSRLKARLKKRKKQRRDSSERESGGKRCSLQDVRTSEC